MVDMLQRMCYMTLICFLMVETFSDIISVDSRKQHVINSRKNFLIQPINQADNADIIMRATWSNRYQFYIYFIQSPE